MGVRTKALLTRRGVPAALTTVYTVPASETVILKEVRLRNTSVSGDTVAVRVADPANAANVYLFDGPLAGLGNAVVAAWLVLQPGHVVQASSVLAGTALQVWISGTELEGVAD